LRRIDVWLDCEDDKVDDTKRRVKDALDKLGIEYTMIFGSYEIVKKGSQK